MNEEQLASDLIKMKLQMSEIIKLNAINIQFFQMTLKGQVEICKQLSEICFELSKIADGIALFYNEHGDDDYYDSN